MSKFSLLTVPSDLPSIWLRRGLNGHKVQQISRGGAAGLIPFMSVLALVPTTLNPVYVSQEFVGGIIDDIGPSAH